MRKWMLCFVLMATGCGGPIEIAYCDSAEGCDSAGSGLETCPTGTLGYVPTRTDATYGQAPTNSVAVLSVLPAVDTDITCQTVVIGIGISADCKAPKNGFSVILLEDDGHLPMLTEKMVFPNAQADLVDAAPNVVEARIQIPMQFHGGNRPVVGYTVNQATCPAAFESACKTPTPMFIDYDLNWHEVKGLDYWVGLDDCAPN